MHVTFLTSEPAECCFLPENLGLWIKPLKKKKELIKLTKNKIPAGNFTQAHYSNKNGMNHTNTTGKMKIVINGKLCKNGSHIYSPRWIEGIKNTFGTSIVTFLARKQHSKLIKKT